ncbi:hypothetical protein RhiJN_13165 [Ceratobasidium sp. AG-Ba]|nr:hypothetical protein RhiJN_13165 [Ceratobasidium sp. AG-Ba]QRW13750.1 hypothetical protein RhiLY_12749 [Ceratobasidium sp. AG-Ba]
MALEGEMAAEGFRAGYEKDVDFGAYRLKATSKTKQDEINEIYANHTAEMKDVASFMEGRYQGLCPAAREHSLEWMEEFDMPEYGQIKVIIDPTDPEHQRKKTVSGSNVTVTRFDFSNAFHCDKDASPFSFGLWLLTDKEGNPVVDDEKSRSAVTGGQFALPELKLAVDFGQCTGLVDMMWRGSQDLHATIRSQTQEGYMRFGTSIQGARRLFDRVQNALQKPLDQVVITDISSHLKGGLV